MTIIPEHALNQHIAILGKTGAGKSYLARGMVEHLLDTNRRVCIIDPKGDWFGLRLSATGKSAGYPVVIFGGAHGDLPINAQAGGQIAELVATGNRPTILDMSELTIGERTRLFMDFAAGLFRHNKGPLWLVIDEVHNFAHQGKVHDVDAGKMLHWANRLASEGRGKGIQIIMASQRPQKVAKDTLTCAETLVAMRVVHNLDRAAIKEWMDGAGDKEKSDAVLKSLASMGRGEAWVWSPELGYFEHSKARKITTYDSMSPAPIGAESLKGWATVDLNEVRVKLADVVKEAEANDPKLLRAKIADLSKQLYKSAAAAQTDPKAIERAVAAAIGKERQEHVKEINERDRIIAGLTGRMNKAHNQASGLVVLLHVNGEATPKSPAAIRPPVKVATKPHKTVPEFSVSRLPAKEISPGISGDITTRQQRFLDAAATLATLGADVTRETVAGWLGVHPRGGSVGEELKALEEQGCITIDRGRITVTEAGQSAAGYVDPAEAIDRAKSGLSARQAKFFERIVGAYPGDISREEIAAEFDLHPRGGSLGEDLGRLVGRGLVENNRGRFKAREFLFLGT
jgi:hypothetical protein